MVRKVVSDVSDMNDMRDVQATLDAWRAQGADRVDRVRFRVLEAFARRASSYEGEARRVLDARLSVMMEAYADVVTQHGAAHAADDSATRVRPRGEIGALVDYMASLASPEGKPDLLSPDYFRQTWTRVSTEKQLRQSLEQVPGNAGPLNSSSLVHRALSLMRELSPGYLQQFLSYVDALSWMEQMTGGVMTPAKEAPRATGVKKGGRKGR
jgi:hypothetical protein